jgi:hypothetical protein
VPDENRYSRIIEHIFLGKYQSGATEVEFERDELLDAADALGIERPRNTGDILYSFRNRNPLPEQISKTAPRGREWIISGRGRSRYVFELHSLSRVEPNMALIDIKIPDATPEIVLQYTQGDEQALLAQIRYNRLIDTFLGITAYSLQNHLRTTVADVGQIEIDEVYVGLNEKGSQFVIPVQAKSASDQIGVVQIRQDLAWCRERLPALVPRSVAAQFLEGSGIALFELTLQGDEVRVLSERHYKLVPGAEITDSDLATYRL